MGLSTGALIVVFLGVAALVAGIVLGVLLYRLDRREGAVRNEVPQHRRRDEVAANSHQVRRPHAA